MPFVDEITESDFPDIEAKNKRVALVFGNSAYTAGVPLRNTIKDANSVAAALSQLKFDSVETYADVNRHEMVNALSNFSVLAEGAEIAIVYFAGHGMEINNETYLLPVDAAIDHVRQVSFEAIGLKEVLGVVDRAKLLRLVILDACRENPFRGAMRGIEGSRSIGRGLPNIEPAVDTLVAYAAMHGTLASDGNADDKNGPYVQALLDHIQTPNLEIRMMFGRVRDSVVSLTNQGQTPHVYGSLGGREIYLKEEATFTTYEGEALAQKLVDDRIKAEQMWYELDLDHTENLDLLQAWQVQYGDRAPLLMHKANIKIGSLKKKQEGQQDHSEFERAMSQDSIEAIQSYISKFPSGLHVDDAKDHLVKLKVNRKNTIHPKEDTALFTDFDTQSNTMNSDKIVAEPNGIMPPVKPSEFKTKSQKSDSELSAFQKAQIGDDPGKLLPIWTGILAIPLAGGGTIALMWVFLKLVSY